MNKNTLRFFTGAFLCALLFGGCAPTMHAQASPPAGSPSPWLCSFDGGRWCKPCPDCPQEASGWLCCSGGACIPNVAQAECLGLWGWCDNYSVNQTCTATGYCFDTAVCHDGE